MKQKASQAVGGNIWKLNVLSALHGAIFLIPIIIPFYRENGITLTQAFFLEAVFSIEIALLELPTGYIADRWGRKHTLVAAFAVATVGWLHYAVGTSFSFFLIGALLMGISASLLSGTLEAITYDTLLERGDTARYRRISGGQNSFTFGTEALCSILGGILAVVSLRAAAWASVASPAIGCLLALSLVEPKRHKLQGTQHVRTIIAICRKTLVQSAPLRGIILIHGLVTTMTLSLFWLTQPYQTQVGLPLGLFGITHAIIVTTGAIAARSTHAISRRIDDRLFLVMIATIVIVSTLGLGTRISMGSLVFFLTARIAWGFLSPLTSDMTNRLTTSDVRATVLSIRALGTRFLFAISSPLVGYAADAWSLSSALLLMGCIGGTFLAVAFFLLGPVWRDMPQ